MHSRPASRRPFRPVLEALEGRALLSVCTVDRLTDIGQGTGMAGDLRYCITQAQNGDSIQFSVTGTINLTRALPDLTRSISIEGPGAGLSTLRCIYKDFYRVFDVLAGARVFIAGLTMTNCGSSDGAGGGGIRNRGTLTVSNSAITGHLTHPEDDYAGGGGVLNFGSMTVVNSTISGNRVEVPSNGNGVGGGILNTATGSLAVVNSTISGNAVLGGDFSTGGGILNSGRLTVSASTISNNQATRTGGIVHVGVSLSMQNTILALNSRDLEGHLTSSGYNLIGNTSGGSGFVATDLLNINPQLGPLQDNGGPTQTHALLSGSPAINAADPAAGYSLAFPKWDQRGDGFRRIAGGRLDIGAFEVQGRGSPGAGDNVSRMPPGFDVAALLIDSAPRRRASSVTAVVVGWDQQD